MCVRCLKEGMTPNDTLMGGVKLRPRWCPTGVDEAWWVEKMYVDSLTVISPHSSSPCQLRYCLSKPVSLCTPCRSQFISIQKHTKSVRSTMKSKTIKHDSKLPLPHIAEAQPPCWLVMSNWNESFLHHTSLLKAMTEEGLTVWSFDPRSQGLSENIYASTALSVDSLDTYATDLKYFLSHMRSVLPPGTRISVLAMGILAHVLHKRRHLFLDGGDSSMGDLVLLSDFLDTGLRFQFSLPLPRWAGGWYANTPDSILTTSGASDTLEVTVGEVSALTASRLISGQRDLIRVRMCLQRVVLVATGWGIRLARVVLPTGVCGDLMMWMESVRRRWCGSKLSGETLTKLLHDTPSVVSIHDSGRGSCAAYPIIGSDGDRASPVCHSASHLQSEQFRSLYRRYPFLQPRRGSIMWYLGLVNLNLYRPVTTTDMESDLRVRWIRGYVGIEQLCEELVAGPRCV